jgi:NAD(P)-dependent dehydrogenase (short-subunit alcohol dehydrogenase family)
MKNRTVIITGSNSGIGRAAARKFAGEGYRVVMACRNLEKSEHAQREILETTGNDSVELMQLDVSSFASIRAFYGEYRKNHTGLDILIHNAAYFNHGEKEYQLSPDTIELTFATNTFGPFLLTHLLKDLLAQSDDPRVLTASTTNIKHFFDPKRELDIDDLHGETRGSKPYNVYKRYGDSKMALLMLTFKMAEEFKRDGISVNAVMIPNIRQERSSLRKFKSYYRVIATLQNLTAKSPERMAETYFHICTSDAFRNITGKLVNIEKAIMRVTNLTPGTGGLALVRELTGSGTYPRYVENREMIERVWEVSRRETNPGEL